MGTLKSIPLPKVNFKAIVIASTVVQFLFNTWVDKRQLKQLQKKEVSKDVKKLGVDLTQYLKNQEYSAEKHKFSMFTSLLSFGLKMGFLWFNGYSYIWNLSKLYVDPTNEFYRGLFFVAIEDIISKFISIPIDYYQSFVLEEKYGFNKKTLWTFVKDLLIGLGLQVFFTPIILKIILTTLQRGGKYFYIYAMVAVTGLLGAFMVIFPNFIQPLFNTFTELEDGELKTEINAMAQSMDFPLKKIFMVDGSKRSNHSNAYFFGFGSNKRIVIFDTLIDQMSNQEIMAVLWHELGHWWHGHVYQILGSQLLGIAAFFFSYGFVKDTPQFFKDFKFSGPSHFIGIMLFSQFFEPVFFANMLFALSITRKNEYQADAFAVEKGMGPVLKKALITLFIQNKGQLNSDPIYSLVHHTHPTLVERSKQIDLLQKQKK